MTTIKKKRLSHGSGYLGSPIEDDGDFLNGIETPGNSGRKSLGGKRRSSFGVLSNSKSPQKSSAEQAHIAQMYQMVIKMSSENKINEKNSWDLDLIDHMGKMIKDEGRSINFQKASCTLDASVKIYSHRVDDTHATSHRILESLSRNGYGDGVGVGGLDENNKEIRPNAKVGSNTTSNRLNIGETIEKDVKNINAPKLDCIHTADPLFQKTSKAFDEGGAKGMLLNNIRVSSTSCNIVFTTTGLGPADVADVTDTDDKAASATQTTNESIKSSIHNQNHHFIDISDLLSRSGINMSGLFQECISPQFDIYRATIGVSDSLSGVMTITNDDINDQQIQPLSLSLSDHQSQDNLYFDGDMDQDDVGDSGMGLLDEDDNADAARANQSSDDPSNSQTLSLAQIATSASSKIIWDTVFSPSAVNTTTTRTQDDTPSKSLSAIAGEEINIISGNDYSYFDVEMLSKSNAWAGAKHWKFASRVRGAAAGNGELSAAPQDAAKEKKTKKAPKPKFTMNFSEEVSQQCFEVPAAATKPKSRGAADPTVLSKLIVEKLQSHSELLQLPPDAGLEAKDLCRLFLCPRYVSAPIRLRHMLRGQTAPAGPGLTLGAGDVIWGHADSTATSGNVEISQSAPFAGYGDDGDDDDNGFDADFDSYSTASSMSQITQDSVLHTTAGLEISLGGLLKAPRVVQRVDVRYATTTTKVNIRRLKEDIWKHIDSHAPAAGAAAGSTATSATRIETSQTSQTPEVSFQELITDLSASQQQQDASLSFYFICLLHLANEKTLSITGNEEMSDLYITR